MFLFIPLTHKIKSLVKTGEPSPCLAPLPYKQERMEKPSTTTDKSRPASPQRHPMVTQTQIGVINLKVSFESISVIRYVMLQALLSCVKEPRSFRVADYWSKPGRSHQRWGDSMNHPKQWCWNLTHVADSYLCRFRRTSVTCLPSACASVS